MTSPLARVTAGASAIPGFYRMTPLERAAGWIFGHAPPDPPGGPIVETPVEVLERLILEALQHPPCMISFSGGRDSSVLLALATRVARTHGLALPVPITRHVPGHVHAEETAWQTLMLHHLKLDNWIRIRMSDDYDLVGPLAETVTAQYGLLWPPTAFLMVPLLSLARGGTLLTGEGGDSMFGTHRCTPLRRIGTSRPSVQVRALRQLPSVLGPRSLRRRCSREQLEAQIGLRWVHPQPRRTILDRWIEEQLDEPLRWRRATDRLPRRNGWRHCANTLQRLAADYNVSLRFPLFDRAFVDAYIKWGHPLGPKSRTTVMRALFDDLLPAEVVRRRTKAFFNTALFGARSRTLIASWGGSGLDDSIVNAHALREEWQRQIPHAGTTSLLQAVWLRQRGVPLDLIAV